MWLEVKETFFFILKFPFSNVFLLLLLFDAYPLSTVLFNFILFYKQSGEDFPAGRRAAYSICQVCLGVSTMVLALNLLPLTLKLGLLLRTLSAFT